MKMRGKREKKLIGSGATCKCCEHAAYSTRASDKIEALKEIEEQLDYR